MDISNKALTIFVTSNIINLSTLCADYIIIKAGLPSITSISVKYPILGCTLVLFETLCPISLGLHLWFFSNNSRV